MTLCPAKPLKASSTWRISNGLGDGDGGGASGIPSGTASRHGLLDGGQDGIRRQRNVAGAVDLDVVGIVVGKGALRTCVFRGSLKCGHDRIRRRQRNSFATGIEEWILEVVNVDWAIPFVPLLDAGGCLARVGIVVVAGLTNFSALGALFWRLALDDVDDCLVADAEESLDVHVVCGEADLEEHLLVDLNELLVPLFGVDGLLAGVGVVVLGRSWVVLVLGAPLEDLLENEYGDLEYCQLSEGELGELTTLTSARMNLKSIVKRELALRTSFQESAGFDRKHGHSWSLSTSLDTSHIESMRELYCEIPREA